jgi:hypothetical protein
MPCSTNQVLALVRSWRRFAAFVVEDLAVRGSGERVDGRVHVREADFGLRCMCHVAAAVGPPPAVGGDAPELLAVDVDELARPVGVDAADRAFGRSIQPPQPVTTRSKNHVIKGSGLPTRTGTLVRTTTLLRAEVDEWRPTSKKAW